MDTTSDRQSATLRHRRPARGRFSLLLVVAAVAGFGLAGHLNESLVRSRAEYHLAAGEPLENAPPLLAFTTVVLSGFRGVLTDALWLRAGFLQDQGRFFEVSQLARWITVLDPRCSEVWAFHAWNIAYNVSVLLSDHRERWRWVKNGLHLLRDEGLRYNPADPDLCFEVGWLFLHKIGGDLDAAHETYQRSWAADMTALLGGARPDYAALEADPSRPERMRRDYALDPIVMRRVDGLYGPLDWRLGPAHAVYWAHRGAEWAEHSGGSLACDRLLCQALSALFRGGRLDCRPEEGVFDISPDLESFPRVAAAYEAALQRHDHESLRSGYAHFLRSAAIELHRAGRQPEAQTAFEMMKRRFPDFERAGTLEACAEELRR